MQKKWIGRQRGTLFHIPLQLEKEEVRDLGSLKQTTLSVFVSDDDEISPGTASNDSYVAISGKHPLALWWRENHDAECKFICQQGVQNSI